MIEMDELLQAMCEISRNIGSIEANIEDLEAILKSGDSSQILSVTMMRCQMTNYKQTLLDYRAEEARLKKSCLERHQITIKEK